MSAVKQAALKAARSATGGYNTMNTPAALKGAATTTRTWLQREKQLM
jgi:hypothetical protein